jgi:hypothetical protein
MSAQQSTGHVVHLNASREDALQKCKSPVTTCRPPSPQTAQPLTGRYDVNCCVDRNRTDIEC